MTKSTVRTMKKEAAGQLGLDARVMLVVLTTHSWGNRLKSHEAETVVAEHFEIAGMDSDEAGTYTKHPVKKEALAPIQKVFSKAKKIHYGRTLPWMDGGGRALKSDGYLAYMKFVREIKAELAAALEQVAMNWDKIVEEAKAKRKGLVTGDDYPTVDQFRERYSIEASILPLPMKGDFRVELPAEQVKEVMAQIEFQTQEAMQNAMTEVSNRIKGVAQRAALRLKNYKPAEQTEDGKRAESDFRDSLVTNIRELIEVLPTLNITGDKRIDEIEKDLRALARYEAKQLKEDAGLRRSTAMRAEAIVAKMEAFI